MRSFLLSFLIFTPSLETVADSKSMLEEHGVKVLGSNLVVDGEKEFRSQMAKAAKIKKSVVDASTKYANGERARAALEREISLMTVRHGQMNAQLAQVAPGDITTNNRLVGLINANVSQLNLKREQLQKGKEYIEQLRGVSSEAREAFVQYVVDSRKMADAVEAKRIAASQNEDVKAAIAELNADGGKYSLDEPSRAFKSVIRKLEDLEARVLTEDVAIRREAGGTTRVAVSVNGQKAVDMVVDSGASIISLPPNLARTLNVKPGPKDPPITLTLADGSEISGTLVKLKNVRVGQFEVDEVNCAVLGPEATNAEPLLGMSFLQEFEFKINSARETMTLTRIKEDSRSTRRK